MQDVQQRENYDASERIDEYVPVTKDQYIVNMMAKDEDCDSAEASEQFENQWKDRSDSEYDSGGEKQIWVRDKKRKQIRAGRKATHATRMVGTKDGGDASR